MTVARESGEEVIKRGKMGKTSASARSGSRTVKPAVRQTANPFIHLLLRHLGKAAVYETTFGSAKHLFTSIDYNMSVQTKATIASFGGKLLKLTHNASTTNCEMGFNLYLPPQATSNTSHKVPLLIYLAGLTCTGDNGAEKGFFQHKASEKGIAVLYPDTSPRGLKIEGEDDSFDFGSGAGFYLDATKAPWNKGYKMYSYITSELPKTVFENFKQVDSERVSIFGHSMGGHGALTLFLKNPGKYKSVSAYAPIANPSKCPWGEKAFSGYLNDKSEWADYDATELVKKWNGGPLDILIDVGTSDNFYHQNQLLPENFQKAAAEKGDGGVRIRFQEGYDHSYFTMASFADDHVGHAARYLLG